MYLIFRSKNATASRAGVYGVEIVLSNPTFITANSDMVYVDISSKSATDADTFVRRIYNNISGIEIDAKAQGSTLLGVDKIKFPVPESETRKIESGWKSCAPMAWARLTGTVSLNNL